MCSARRVISATLALGAVSSPLTAAPTAFAGPSIGAGSALTAGRRDRPGPWSIDAKEVTIRSKAYSKSAGAGIPRHGNKFAVHKSAGSWHYIADTTTDVKGWASGAQVYRNHENCPH